MRKERDQGEKSSIKISFPLSTNPFTERSKLSFVFILYRLRKNETRRDRRPLTCFYRRREGTSVAGTLKNDCTSKGTLPVSDLNEKKYKASTGPVVFCYY